MSSGCRFRLRFPTSADTSRTRTTLADVAYLLPQRGELVRIVPRAQARDRFGIRAAARHGVGEFLEIVLVAGRRYGHQDARGLVAAVRDVMGHAGRQEQVGA